MLPNAFVETGNVVTLRKEILKRKPQFFQFYFRNLFRHLQS